MIRFANVYGGCLSRAVWSYRSYVIVVLLGYSLLIVLFFHNQLLVDNETGKTTGVPPKGRSRRKETLTLSSDRSNFRMFRDRMVGSRNISTTMGKFRAEITEPPELSNRDESRNDHAFPLVADCLSSSTEFRFLGNETAFQKLGDHYFYSAYFDDREDNGGFPFIRVIALLRKSEILRFFCHIPHRRAESQSTASAHSKKNASDGEKYKRRYRSLSRPSVLYGIADRNGSAAENPGENERSTSTVEYVNIGASAYQMCENHNRTYGGWILSCRLTAPPLRGRRPPCEIFVSTNPEYNASSGAVVGIPVFRVRNAVDRRPGHTFGVCVPPLFGHVPSTTLVEFVEFSRLLGAEHFVIYRHEVSTEVAKTLAFYASRGLVTTIRWELPVDETLVWYHGQLVAVNDCLYRTMHAFQYLAFNDVDEFIVPHVQLTWGEMVSSLRRSLASDQRFTTSETSKLPPVNGLLPNDHHRDDRGSLLNLVKGGRR